MDCGVLTLAALSAHMEGWLGIMESSQVTASHTVFRRHVGTIISTEPTFKLLIALQTPTADYHMLHLQLASLEIANKPRIQLYRERERAVEVLQGKSVPQ